MKISKEKLKTILTGAALGALAFFLIYGFSALNFTNDEFLTQGYIERDSIQHYTGWLLYRDSPWQYPLGVGAKLLYPTGTSVAYTDSIPLFALIFKALSPILPSTFQYFGLFAFSSFVLMGACSALLLGLFTENHIKIALGVLLFVFSPIMIERAFRHTALSAQFLIVLSLYFYFKNQKSEEKSYLPYIFITLLAVFIHPYFLPLCYAVMFADVTSPIFCKKSPLKGFKTLALSLVLTLGAAHVIGFFYTGGAVGSSSGYGYFSWNLNSFFNPTSRGVTTWSKFIPPLTQIRGNYESFTYLGLGVLIAFSLLFIKNIKKLPRLFKDNITLALCCLVLGLFAITGGVTFFGHTRDIPLPQAFTALASTFRASGRMMWLLWYLIVLFAALWLFELKGKSSIIILTLVCFVQLFDLSPALMQKHKEFTSYPDNLTNVNRIKSDFWQDNVKNTDLLASFDEDIIIKNIELALIGAKNNLNTDIDIGARYDVKRLQANREEIMDCLKNKDSLPSQNAIYVSDNMFEISDFEIYDAVTVGEVDNLLVVSENKNIDTSKMRIITNKHIVASYKKLPANGVIYLENREKWKKLLDPDTVITNWQGEEATVEKIQEAEGFLEIYIKEKDKAEMFTYPAIFTVSEN